MNIVADFQIRVVAENHQFLGAKKLKNQETRNYSGELIYIYIFISRETLTPIEIRVP